MLNDAAHVLTAQQDSRRNTPDPDILARAHALGRAVLTHNRRHFERLDRQGALHSGMVSATQDPHNHLALAAHNGNLLAVKADLAHLHAHHRTIVKYGRMHDAAVRDWGRISRACCPRGVSLMRRSIAAGV